MPRVRKEKPRKNTISLDDFTKRLCAKNNELLEGMLTGIQNGELELEIEDGIEYAENIIEDWCDTERPHRQQHLKMVSALFVVMLSEELLAENLDDEHDRDPEPPSSNGRPGIPELTIEVLRTVRAVWGIRDKASS